MFIRFGPKMAIIYSLKQNQFIIRSYLYIDWLWANATNYYRVNITIMMSTVITTLRYPLW